jgi:hypothetical protein
MGTKMVAVIATNSQLDFEHFERSQVFVRRAPSIRAQGENTHLLDSSEPLIVAGSIRASGWGPAPSGGGGKPVAQRANTLEQL